MHTQRIWLLYTHKDIKRYHKDTKTCRFYAHLKDMTAIHTQKYAKIQRYTDSMHTQRIWLLYTHKDKQRDTKIHKDRQRYKYI